MKKISLFLSLLTLLSISSCTPKIDKLSFEKNEYIVHSGEKISVVQNVSDVNYLIIGKNDYSIYLDEKTGIFTFDDMIPNYLQVMVIAKKDTLESEPIVVTLIHDYRQSEVSFNNLTDYIMNGEIISAQSSLSYSITYSLKDEVDGISIDSSSGKVNFAPSVLNDQAFTVVAKTHGNVQREKTFYAIKSNFAKVENTRQAIEKNGNVDVIYFLDFSEIPDIEEKGIIALTTSRNNPVSSENYQYDKNQKKLRISSKYLSTLPYGENTLKIITARNTISINVEVATKFIYTAEDLQSINKNEESLSGYYILMDDIDLSSYLSENCEGYNDGKGWIPIGQYNDVTDPNVATRFAFKGTFDGNGHVVSNLLMNNKKDTYAFNAGLFGYVTSSATIRNLGVSGNLNVASYSGGLVGSNSGIIENCWSDVYLDVFSGESAYRYVGGFAGSNFGTIRNCYSLNDVRSDTYYGAFIGSNEGEITNCFARVQNNVQNFAGLGTIDDTSNHLFLTEQEMKSYDYSSVFSQDYWNIKDSDYPTLKENLKQYAVNKFEIDPNILKNNYYIGDKIDLNVNIYPRNYQEEYEEKVVYSIEKNGGAKIENGKILNTLNASKNEIVVNASIEIEGQTYFSSITIQLGKRIRDISLDNVLTNVTAGSSYKLEANLSPLDATEKVVYHLLGENLEGITVFGDTLNIEEDVTADSFQIYGSNQNNTIRSEIITVSIKKLQRINFSTIYLDDKNFEFILPSDKIKNISYLGQNVNYQQNGNIITISKDLFEDKKDEKLDFIFEDENQNLFIGSGYYLSHNAFTLDSIKEKENDIIEISSKEDFYKYFNLNESSYQSSKYENYNKTYVLTKDIDFQGDLINGIGFTKDGMTSHPFAGTIYGLGHTISNYQIKQNEYALIDSSSDSKNYGVGLFASLSGRLYDINIKNVKVSGKNFVGGLVGMMTGNSIVENCHLENETNSNITGYNNYIYTVGDIRVGGVVGRLFEGQVLACTYNGKEKNTIG